MNALLAAAIAAALTLGIATVVTVPTETVGALLLASTVAAIPRMRRLTTRQLMDKLGIQSRETLRKLQKKPGFPQPVYDDGSPVKYFFEHEADAYLQQLAETRDRAKRAPAHLELDGGDDAAGHEDLVRRARTPGRRLPQIPAVLGLGRGRDPHPRQDRARGRAHGPQAPTSVRQRATNQLTQSPLGSKGGK